MSRTKKSRKAKGVILDTGPTRRERLADPDSYDSRRRKALEKKKKNLSVYEKERLAEQEQDDKKKQNKGEERQTRLADKIRRLNKQKQQEQE